MLHQIGHYLTLSPLLALFITLILGFILGKFRIKTFVLGGIAGSLIMGVVIGQFGIELPSEISTIFFALFIYAVGYQGGPQFFRSLNRNTLVQLISATITCVLGLVCVLIAAWWFHLDRGTAAGLAAGGLTQSAMIGTASDAIARLGLSAQQTHIMQANVAVGYAVCYIFGSFGPILMLTAIFPSMMKWNIRKEALDLAKALPGGQAKLEPGQYHPIETFDTRIYELGAACPAVGKTATELYQHANHFAVTGLIRQGKNVEVDATTVLQKHDIVAITAHVEAFINSKNLFVKEISQPAIMDLTEEVRDIILTNKTFDNKTIPQWLQQTDEKIHYGLFIKSIARLGERLKPTPDLVIKRGDEIQLMGRPTDLDRVSSKLGKTISGASSTDFISFSIGIAIGMLLGALSIKIFGISLSLGVGGGCLFSGLVMGWLRSRHPLIGAFPTGASNFLRDFGLAVFVATVGISAGPQAITSIKQYGMELFLLGMGVTIIPQIITFYISYYLLKIKNPIELLATIAGGRSANPGFAALLEKAGNSTPVVPFTATYAIANIWLTLWGPIIVGLVTTNVI